MISTVSKPYHLYLYVALLVTVVMMPACYTILQHPRLAQLDYRRPDNNQCLDCHTADEIWSFHHLPKAPVTDVPWWYERFWGYEDSLDFETVPLPHSSHGTPTKTDTPHPGVINTPSVEQKPNAAAIKQEKKETGDGNVKDNPKKSRRPPRPKGEKKKKDKKKKP